MPTLLELTGQQIPKQAQGQSLVPFLAGQRDMSEARRYAFCERVRGNPDRSRKVRPGTRGAFMVRGGGFKFVRYHEGQEYLYDREKDPGETENVAGAPEYRSRRNELEAELDRWLKQTGWPG